jgi:hypothetical protein
VIGETTGATGDRAIGPTRGGIAKTFAATTETCTEIDGTSEPIGAIGTETDAIFGMTDGIFTGIVTNSGFLSGGGGREPALISLRKFRTLDFRL